MRDADVWAQVDTPASWSPRNRKERRDAIRRNPSRPMRMHVYGFGRLRRHFYANRKLLGQGYARTTEE